MATLLANIALADSVKAPSRVDGPCPGKDCSTTEPTPAPPAPAPQPVAPKPTPAPVIIRPPEPVPAPVPVIEIHEITIEKTVENPYDDSGVKGSINSLMGYVRLGGSVGAVGGAGTMPAQVVDERPHMLLPMASFSFGAYVGIGGHRKGAPYADLSARLDRGSVASGAWNGGLTVGAALTDNFVLGVRAGAVIRDYGLSEQTYIARNVGGNVGLVGIIDLTGKNMPAGLDLSLVPSLRAGTGSVRNSVTSQTLQALEVQAGLELRIGVSGPHHKK
ncbi:MAG: hypothetical protein WAZ14_02555 [Patescibacteria group bacterium]